MRLAGPFATDECRLRSRAAMRAIARRRGARWVRGKGMAPGKQVGPGPRNLPGVGFATHATRTLRAKSAGQAYLQVSDEMTGLPEGTEKVDDVDVPVTRTGTERDPETVLSNGDGS